MTMRISSNDLVLFCVLWIEDNGTKRMSSGWYVGSDEFNMCLLTSVHCEIDDDKLNEIFEDLPKTFVPLKSIQTTYSLTTGAVVQFKQALTDPTQTLQ